MATSSMNRNIPSTAPSIKSPNVDDWEEWEDDEVVTPVDAYQQAEVGLCQPSASSLHDNITKTTSTRGSRISTAKIRRLKSRQRQKAQNAKAGIRLITDMSAFRRSNYNADNARGSPRARAGKFVDAAALRALEGEPSSSSVGNWNWLKKKNGKSPISATHDREDRFKGNQPSAEEDGPIVIGVSLASSERRHQDMGPETAPTSHYPQVHAIEKAGNTSNPNAQKSVWSPDTPDTSFSFSTRLAASKTISQAPVPVQFSREQTLPSVPALPTDYDKKTSPQNRTLSLELGKSPQEDSDSSTPHTLFEEDDVPSPQRRMKAKELDQSPESACSRSQGWWDHVITPFFDKTMSFSSRNHQMDFSPKDGDRKEPWAGCDDKPSPAAAVDVSSSSSSSRTILPTAAQASIVSVPAPQQCSSTYPDAHQHEGSRMPPAKAVRVPVAGSRAAATPRVVVTCDNSNTPDCPPPYSPPEKQQDGKHIRYRAVFPPGHPLHSQFPPTPRPASPGLGATMTSQRGAPSTIDHTPALLRTQTSHPVVSAPLPVRPTGTFVPPEHAYAASGTRHKVERRRRRHEKEDVIARRAGGFWRGRGCIPSKGCFGRTGREGRQRRRVWMMIWGGVIALLLLVILLAVFLTRRLQRYGAEQTPSIWVNLTDYPPMPTGVLTVVGPDNTAAKSGCTEPSTLWSCSLPKEQHASVLPYRPDQPTLVMQIQWDNGTARKWNAADGHEATAAAASVVRRAHGAASFARDGHLRLRQRQAQSQTVTTVFAPNPAPPTFKEMWFLGETTDDIRSDQKAGEPTPFYISLLPSANGLSMGGGPSLSRRESSPTIGNETFRNLIPPPDVEADGTSVPALLMPQPVQQPVRLFDRGLPTEHYGFYTYFKKTIFLKSITTQNQTEQGNNSHNNNNNNNSNDHDKNTTTDDAISLDKNGGCRKAEASHLVTWGETRLRIQIWTKLLEKNTSSLLKADGGGGGDGVVGSGSGSIRPLIRPGTMPYPVSITQDTHGGDPNKKLVWERAINERLQVQPDQAQALINNMGIGGTWINRRGRGDAKMGGFDGGTGGCRCEWVNWV
ncbi:hypothetical protein E4U43_000395 [Claviceps pusilla]|uniref:Glycoprotease family protein n=1 Tax=Claviceps pusilla TaxID=123648 RepID=A0A9P7N9P1_9HYPO|nr:hypothetical protein E4U43_000395 [Claviceps pusilla]